MWKVEVSVTTGEPTSSSQIQYPPAVISLHFHAILTTSSWREIASLALVTDAVAIWVIMQIARTAEERFFL